MSSYSKKERYLATVLSSFPQIKYLIKNLYVRLNALIYNKNYSLKIFDPNIDTVHPVIENEEQRESFFGYYDKSPVNNEGWIISHISNISTKKLPDSAYPVDIVITNIYTKEQKIIGDSTAYNWQQGTRAQWLNDDLIMYNDFDSKEQKYISKIFSLNENKIIQFFNSPVQDAFKTEYFLSINYTRLLLATAPDYGYRNIVQLSKTKYADLTKDGIWKIDYQTKESQLLHSLANIVACEHKPLFDECFHTVNHVMIRKDGKGFMFIHRYYKRKQRFDRLIYSDFNTLKILVDYGMISHCYWIDDNTLFGYLKIEEVQGYYYIEVDTSKATLCEEMTELGLGDGHPSYNNSLFVFDTYPNRSCMQQLILYDARLKKIIPLLELYQGLDYINQSRCDLHPRFSFDRKWLFFDSVYTGKRQHYYIDISNFKK